MLNMQQLKPIIEVSKKQILSLMKDKQFQASIIETIKKSMDRYPKEKVFDYVNGLSLAAFLTIQTGKSHNVHSLDANTKKVKSYLDSGGFAAAIKFSIFQVFFVDLMVAMALRAILADTTVGRMILRNTMGLIYDLLFRAYTNTGYLENYKAITACVVPSPQMGGYIAGGLAGFTEESSKHLTMRLGILKVYLLVFNALEQFTYISAGADPKSRLIAAGFHTAMGLMHKLGYSKTSMFAHMYNNVSVGALYTMVYGHQCLKKNGIEFNDKFYEEVASKAKALQKGNGDKSVLQDKKSPQELFASFMNKGV